MGACLIQGKVRDKEGNIVDSKLFSDLKEILPKDIADKYYYILTSENFKQDENYHKLSFDENGEPTIDSLLKATSLRDDISDRLVEKKILGKLDNTESNTDYYSMSHLIDDILAINKELADAKDGTNLYRVGIIKDYDDKTKKTTLKAKVYKSDMTTDALWDYKMSKISKDLDYLLKNVQSNKMTPLLANSISYKAASMFPEGVGDVTLLNENAIYNIIYKNKNKNPLQENYINPDSIASDTDIYKRTNAALLNISIDDWIKFIDANNIDIDKEDLRNNFSKYQSRLLDLVRKRYQINKAVLDFITGKDTREHIENMLQRLNKQVDEMWSKIQLPPKEEKPDISDTLIDQYKEYEINKENYIDIKKIIEDMGEDADILTSAEKSAVSLIKKIIDAEYNEQYVQSRVGGSDTIYGVNKEVRENVLGNLIDLYENGQYNLALYQYYVSVSKRINEWNNILKKPEPDMYKQCRLIRQIHFECIMFKQISEYFRKNSSSIIFKVSDMRDEILDIFHQIFDDKGVKVLDVLKESKSNPIKFIDEYPELESLADAYWATMEKDSSDDNFKNLNDKMAAAIQDIHDEIYKKEKFLVTKILNNFQPEEAKVIPFGKDKGKTNDIEELLTRAKRDMWGVERLLDSMAEAPDMILRLIDHITKHFKNSARLKSLEFARRVKVEAKILENAGVKDTKWMFKHDENGNKTGRYITEGDAEYYEMIKNPAKKRFYDFFMDSKEMLDLKYPDNTVKRNAIINIRKDLMERIKESGSISDAVHAYTESIKDEWTNKNVENREDVEGYSQGTYTLEGEEVNILPIYYINIDFRDTKELNEISEDAVSTLIAYGAKAYDYAESNRIINAVEITKELLKDREIPVEKDGLNVVSFVKRQLNKEQENSDELIYYKDNGASNISKRLQGYVDVVYYAKSRKGDKAIGKLSAIKVVDKFNGWTARATMSLSLLNGISNVATGTFMMWYETLSKRYFSPKDLAWAEATYAKNLVGTLGNLGSRIKDDKLSLFTELFDVTQHYDKEMLNNVDWDKKTKLGRLELGETLMFMQDAGEHWMSHRTALAVANTVKLKDKEGNTINLWDALEVKYYQENGELGSDNRNLGAKLVIKDGVTKLDGSKFTSNDIIKTQTKISGINHSLHGIYNKIDSNLIQTTAVGRAAYLFRKWMWSSVNKRFSNINFNYDTQSYEEGYYRSCFRFIKTLAKDIKQMQFDVALHWNELHPVEKANVKHAIIETMTLLSIIMLNLLVDWGDDDDDDWAKNMTMYQAIRLQSELSSLTPWGVMHESIRLLKSPLPAVSTLDNFVQTLGALWVPNWFEEEERGMFKGHSKGFRLIAGNKVINPFYQVAWKTANVETQTPWYQQ